MNEQGQNQESVFPISTLQDIWSLPTVEQMATCLEELSEAMIAARTVAELAKQAAGEEVAVSDLVKWPETVEWNDDSKGEVGFIFKDHDGKEVFSAKCR